MLITDFQLDDLHSRWHLNKVAFDQFNLLVGVSGVGKTKILDALRRVCGVAEGAISGHLSFCIGFEHEHGSFQWQGRTEAASDDSTPDGSFAGKGELIEEQLMRRDTGEVLIKRDRDSLRFMGNPMPQLTRSSSALSLLDDARIAAIRRDFRWVLFSHAGVPPTPVGTNHEWLEKRLKLYRTQRFDQLRETIADTGLSGVSRWATLAAFYLQEVFPAEWVRLKESFLDIFPSVEDLRVNRSLPSGDGARVLLEFSLKETGIAEWVPQADISSGMLRSLVHLVELMLAPSGSVLVVDEFENSLGANCMPELVRTLHARTDCQFILTSHHPYIINNIRPELWKLVRRSGYNVSVISARDIPSISGASHHEAFLRLINLPEFEEGIG